MVVAVRHRFGVLRAEDGEAYHFEHRDVLESFDLLVGDRVMFDLVQPVPVSGRRAVDVVLVAPGGDR